MIAFIEKNKSEITNDNNSFIIDNYTIWFKGYFFIKNEYFSENKATKHILSLYKTKKLEDEIKSCNGIFTCVIINKINGEVIIVNDRFGFHHLFYVHNKDQLIICSDYWQLVSILESPEINNKGLSEMLSIRFVLSGHTIINNISEILPASIYKLKYTTKRIELKRDEYWNFTYAPQKNTLKNAETEIYNTLNQIIKKYTNQPFKGCNIGLNLTGGVDSRFLLSLLKKNDIPAEKINTFTFGNKECEDIKIAKELAEISNTTHSEYKFDEPFFDFFDTKIIDNLVSIIGHSCYYFQAYGVSKLTSSYSNVDYLLTGSDGFCIGSIASEALFSIKTKDELVNFIYNSNAGILSIEQQEEILKYKITNPELNIKESIRTFVFSNDRDIISNYFDWIFKNRLRKYILSIYELLNKDTKTLFPFYDYEFMDLMAKLPPEALLNQKVYVNAMYKHAYIGSQNKFKQVAVEKRVLTKNIDEYLLSSKGDNLVFKILKKLFSLPEKNASHEIYKTYKNNKRFVEKLIRIAVDTNSKIFSIADILNQFKKNKKNEHFFKFGLPVILTILRLEKKLENIDKKSTN